MSAKTVSITGSTYAVHSQLKALGGHWNSQLKSWDVPEAKAAEARALVESAPAKTSEPIKIPLDRYRISGKSYVAECPACARRGDDKKRNNLSVKRAEPTIYRCWKGCTTDEIKLALGLDTHSVIEFIAEPGRMR